jgi:carbonic anhydrase
MNMDNSFKKILQGYETFRKKYAEGDRSVMEFLSEHGQQPHIMVVACCDARVDPALILNCDPGDLFVVRNVANIVPPYEKDDAHHGTSAALEFGLKALKISHLILLGHSQCGGIQAVMNHDKSTKNDFINNWVSLIKENDSTLCEPDDYAKLALMKSYENCMTFPWIAEKVAEKKLVIHLWFFDIKTGKIFSYSDIEKEYVDLTT